MTANIPKPLKAMTDAEIGTLAELNVKPGDVVRPEEPSFVWPDRDYEITEDRLIVDGDGYKWQRLPPLKVFRIVSRASQSDTPKPLKEMTDAEIGALVRAHKEGQIIECLHNGRWFHIASGDWFFDRAYRIRPEPVRETVTLTGGAVYEWRFSPHEVRDDTHRITFDMIDGKPDLTSIRMEEL